jgi:hypothetical protein
VEESAAGVSALWHAVADTKKATSKTINRWGRWGTQIPSDGNDE